MKTTITIRIGVKNDSDNPDEGFIDVECAIDPGIDNKSNQEIGQDLSIIMERFLMRYARLLKGV